MLIVGLTGNIGSGKTSISKILSSRGFSVIDADLIARKILEDKRFLNKLFKEFDYKIMKEDSTLDRKKLSDIVFKDKRELDKLNKLTSPEIKELILKKVENLENKGEKYVFLDAALLIEHGYLKLLDYLVLVICDENEQIKRIINRDKCTEENAKLRIKSQINQWEKIKFADYVIDNSRNKKELEEKVDLFLKHMKDSWIV